MTEEQSRPLKSFPGSNPFARSRRKQEVQPAIKLDPIKSALEASESMPKLLKPEEVAASLGVSERTLERWRMTGEGPAYVSLSRKTVRYPEHALAEFVIARLRVNTAQ